jgi:hypothetical protein
MSKPDLIKRVEIDQEGRLCVYPVSLEFPYIYREAKEVHWDVKSCFLYSPHPKQWTYVDWFFHILKVAKDVDASLYISEATEWLHVPDEIRDEILKRHENTPANP